MGRRKFWTDERLDELTEMGTKVSAETIAKHFGVTVKTIKRTASNYGISIAFHRKVWTKEEEAYVLRWAGRMSRTKMAEKLGRSVNSLSYHACYVLDVSLRLKKK
ncbi:hypothetical protein [Salmonella phage SE131]|uniref:Uncharacterized protein n=1 Tax=Salmonella phage SE131 TaxID=2081631 RepID=A0A2P1CAA6_9CAUD|nr:hypothetical protein PQC35_gp131 [Salmonella phage SE131]AVJ48168.1 hypothetical protein [Salmonella phage SE131]